MDRILVTKAPRLRNDLELLIQDKEFSRILGHGINALPKAKHRSKQVSNSCSLGKSKEQTKKIPIVGQGLSSASLAELHHTQLLRKPLTLGGVRIQTLATGIKWPINHRITEGQDLEGPSGDH